MAVVIDQMDVDVSEPQQQTRGGGESNGGGGGGDAQPPKPEEIERALRTQAERAERVWAH